VSGFRRTYIKSPYENKPLCNGNIFDPLRFRYEQISLYICLQFKKKTIDCVVRERERVRSERERERES